jgi:streptogramin lyase
MNNQIFAQVVGIATSRLRSFSLVIVASVLAVMLGAGASCLANAQTAHFTGYVPSAGKGNFGALNIGTKSSQVQLSFKFDTGGTIGSISALTEGVPSLDFANAYPTDLAGDPVNGCYPGVDYATGATCTLYATFTPTEPGNRYGAFVLNNSSGAPVAVGYVSGSGVGPLLNYLPAVQSAIETGTIDFNPYGVAVDSGRNVYVADENSGSIFKNTYTAATDTYSLSTVATGLLHPESVAVDGAGNIYFPTWGGHSASGEIVVETPLAGSPGSYTKSVLTVTGLGEYPFGVAVDGKGDLFISDPSVYRSGKIYELSPTGVLGQYTQTTIASSLIEPVGIAADISGNVFFADEHTGFLYKLAVASGYTKTTIDNSTFETPVAVAIDPYGNIYVTDTGQDEVFVETLQSDSSYLPTVLATADGNGLNTPSGVAVDGVGNLYIANTESSQVLRLDSSDIPTLDFAATPDYTFSSDSPQTVTIANIGNATLDFLIPATSGANNPSIAPNSFQLSSSDSSDCPLTSYGASSGETLLPGAECSLPVSFDPVVAGAISGELVLSDNELNMARATQFIHLNGTGFAGSITWSPPASIIYGNNLSTVLNATSNIPGTFVYSDSSGTVTASTVLPVGKYQLNVTLTPQYGGVTFKKSITLTVTPATLTVTPNPATVIYDQPVITYTYTITGLVNNDTTSAYSGVPTITTTAALLSTALGKVNYNSNQGTYTIKTTWGSLASTNYTFAFQTATLTIAPSPNYITVTANNLSMTHGHAVPTLTYTVTGLIPGDSLTGQTTGTLTLSTTATSSSPAGSYPITVSQTLTQRYGNYAGIHYVNGTMTVN